MIMSHRPAQKSSLPVIITAESVSSLIRICREISARGYFCPESTVTGGAGYLRLIARLPEDFLLYEAILPFGRLFTADEAALAAVSEHDRAVISKNAVSLLSGLSH